MRRQDFLVPIFLLLTLPLCTQVNVTFELDMSAQSVSPSGVHLAGSMNGWNTSVDQLTDQGGGIYSITLNLEPGADYEYKFLNGDAWGTEEVPPMACAVGGNNRIFTTPTVDATLPLVPFSGCPSPNLTQEITFSVDMNGLSVSPDGVHVAGNFNGWNTSATQLTDLGNSIYQATTTVLSSITTVQYKFLNGNAWGTEEVIPEPCVNSNSNREYSIEGEGPSVELSAYEFGTCVVVPLVVPVELSSFHGKPLEEGNLLMWTTESEMNNAGFEVQRSVDGKDWLQLSFVQGSGSAQGSRNYRFLDKYSGGIDALYRLRQIDFNGIYEYSNIISVRTTRSTSELPATLYPNPVEDQLTIVHGKGKLVLYDISSRPVIAADITDDVFHINTASLPSGTYVLTLHRVDGSVQQQILLK